MYNIRVHNGKKLYLLAELINVFLRPDEYELLGDEGSFTNQNALTVQINEKRSDNRDFVKQDIYSQLKKLTGKYPKWGILTGIRPVKLAGELCNALGSRQKAEAYLTSYYLLKPEISRFLCNMYEGQMNFCGQAKRESMSLYVGIPFCPTRCVYCSFASNQVSADEVERYMPALLKEVESCGTRAKKTGKTVESIYIGGGTPTTLDEKQLEELLTAIEENFDLSKLKEFTVEAGRPDTITRGKLEVLNRHSIRRISINPQSLKEDTMIAIGRDHTPDDFYKAYEVARDVGFDVINCDIIAGLPGETVEDFIRSLTGLIELKPENITVHCMAVKRASKLLEIDENYHYKMSETVETMLAESRRLLRDAGYYPYYLYRQKHMAGALENTGYCLPGKESVYNIRIMDEHQMILALGAGGISKAYDFDTNHLSRVPNVSNYEEYISRIDEMIERKEKNIFGR